MANFYCSACNKEFESDTTSKREFSDPIYGNCWRNAANCPICGLEADEKKEPKMLSKKKFSVELTPPCCSGGGGRCCG
ncbi:MAG: hypothetical protein EHM20_09900 [Alphaproteobacteria bacterium]|nr:MAG: hypothetical protein EHM20_09900 [Alphaproteobacteria bacterium]